MRRLMSTAAVEPGFDRRQPWPADDPARRKAAQTDAISPAAIIARAAATVPNEDDEFDAAPTPAPQRTPDDTLVLPSPRPNRRARRRPYALIAARARRFAYSARRAPPLIILFAIPLVMWQAGLLDGALDRADGAAHRLTKGAHSAMNLHLRHLRVKGRQRTSIADLRQAAALRQGQDLMEVDLAALRERLEALPWVSRVAVERRLPDTLLVKLREHRPIARYRVGSRTILIGDGGTAIPVEAGAEHRDLIILAGDGAPEATRALFVLLDKAPRLRTRVAAAVRRGGRRWDILFANRVILRLPEDHQEAAWLRFAALEREHNLLDRGAATFDLRLRDRMVIKPRPTNTTTSG